MHKCAAPFLDEEHRRQHQEAIQRLHELLDGRFDRVEEWLVAKRDKMSEHLMFERAAEVQVRIDALHQLLRRQSILEAAVQSRCVLIRDDGRNGQEGRLLLVAHGQVLSARSLAGMSSSAILSWIRAHTVLMKLPRLEQSELDAASVLERWISERRNTIRWTAIRHDATDDELQEQIDYVTTSAQLASAAVPVAE
jgi:excinuclease UvrABC nuclease subunit